MVRPAYLSSGDKVAIICTARFANEEDLKDGIKLLEKCQLKPVVGKSVGLKSHQFGGDDKQRAEDLQTQLDDPEIKAIWCAKGGYGSARILDYISFESFCKNPKWIIGYSDVTALHLHLQHLGFASLHAQMPVGIDKKSSNTIDSLKQSLFSEPYNIQYDSKYPTQSGVADAEIIGGNLSVLYSILGSSSKPDFSGKILFIEDIDEYLYHIDRMMLNLYRRGILDNLKGLIVGGMTEMNDNTIPFGKNAYQIINQYVNKLNIPVAYDCPVGHDFHNLALTFGVKAKLIVDNQKVSIEY